MNDEDLNITTPPESYDYFNHPTSTSHITTVESSEWEMSVANDNHRPVKGTEPNWFRRKMQGLILGVKWSKDK